MSTATNPAFGDRTEDVQVSVGADASTVTFGGSKVEVSVDGKKVTAYTSDGVETKAATNGAPPASAGAGSAEGTLISVSKDFNTVVLNGVTIERAADNHLVISAPGIVITKPGPSNDSKKKELEVGDKMEDGTVFAGISPVTKQPMYARPADEPLTFKWKQAMDYAAKFEGHGKPKGAFRVPMQSELNVMFENKAKIGGFNETWSSPAVWYWSSTETRVYAACAWDQRFSDGDRDWHPKSYGSSLRLVRG